MGNLSCVGCEKIGREFEGFEEVWGCDEGRWCGNEEMEGFGLWLFNGLFILVRNEVLTV